MLKVSVNGTTVKRFYDFTEMKIKYKDDEYSLEGTFTLPVYVTSSKAWKEYKAAQEKIVQEKLAQEKAEQARIAQEKAEQARIIEKKRLAEERRNTPVDADGNVYHTVKIGTQTWTVENLRTTKYNDGTAISEVTDQTEWKNCTTPGYCWYNNDETANKSTYGALYNWYAVNTGKLAPEGWHVPTDADWNILAAYLGGESVAGGALKEAGTTHWTSPNTGANNSSSFSALPGGYRSFDGYFFSIGNYGYWWSATEGNASVAYGRSLGYDYSDLDRYNYYKSCGFSVRLVRDSN